MLEPTFVAVCASLWAGQTGNGNAAAPDITAAAAAAAANPAAAAAAAAAATRGGAVVLSARCCTATARPARSAQTWCLKTRSLVVGFTSPYACASVSTRKQRHQQKLAGIPRCALVEMG